MKVAALFQLFWAAATINFGLVIAAPRGPLHNGLSKRTTTYFCDSTAEEVITYSLGEMIEMLTTAIDRTLNLMAFLADPPIHINQQGQLLQSTFYTFESIFGKLEYGAGSSENSDAISRVQTLITLAETMRSSVQGILSNQYFEIYCSDAWLISEDRDGDISLINPYLYWDNRVTRTTSLGIDFSTSQGICRDDAAFYAWVNPAMSSSQAPGGQTSVMTLCQNALSGWVSNYQAQNTMKVAAQQTYPDKVSLEIFQGLTLTTALLHEFTHAPAIVGPNYLIDESCNDNGQIKSAYGWFCVAQLAATPSKALNNADSFSFYITAMYLSLSDWSTGSSVTIPPDTTPADEDGLASMMSKLTLD